MDEQKNQTFSDSRTNDVPNFAKLVEILDSKTNNSKEKCTVWRQQSLILKSFEEKLFNDLMQLHWEQHCSIVENSQEIRRKVDATLGKNEWVRDIGCSVIEDMNIPSEHGAGNKMFRETCPKTNHKPNDTRHCVNQPIYNTIENSLSKTRNTMENFLKGSMPNKNQLQSFNSARQMLAAQTLMKPLGTNGAVSHQSNTGTNFQNPDVGFNFSATKKSLGSLGRLPNSTRKNFVSPIPRSSITINLDTKCEENESTEAALILSHPALKNVDPKMVEQVNNEIIHKFKLVDWSEIAGLDYAKSIIKEAVVYPLLRPDIFTGLRRPPRGILLFGPPGTGKTLIGKCIASQSSSTFFSISSASLTSKWMGEGEKMVRALFAVAVARQPSVIFIDEIDSLLSQRSENENEGTRRLKTEFLVRLDGAATSDDDRVLIVGATNRPQELDEAVRRRFVKRLYVPLPDVDARAEILTNLLKTVENSLNTNQVKEISRLAEGYSGADMDSLCREASMEPLRSLSTEAIITFQKENLRNVNIDDFYNALKKIRPSVSQTEIIQYAQWNKTYGSRF